MLSRIQVPLRISELATGPRAIPLAIAGVICTMIAVVLGYGAWYLLGDRRPVRFGEKPELTGTIQRAAEVSEPPQPRVVTAPAGELTVPRGAVTLSGDKDRPPRIVTLEAFAIGETEVTNDQYFHFVREAGYKPPAHWIQGKYPVGAGNEPVTNVSWRDAVTYCDWLSGKIGAPVRLPSEAQWEMAAKGPGGFKYPWGNEWTDEAAVTADKKGQVRAVMSYPLNRSPYGAYDMAGNVWEWVANPGHDDDGFPVASDGVEYRLAKGGSANEPAEYITSVSRVKLRADTKDKYLGFRYVVIRSKAQQTASRPESEASNSGTQSQAATTAEAQRATQ